MSVLLTASSQLYWHEKLKENQEKRFTEQIFDSLEQSK
jgi:hypothetical protein